jgi:hypothetical protein
VAEAEHPLFSSEAGVAVGSQPLVLASGDFNDDGSLDLATANHRGDSASVALGTGDGSFSPATHYAVGSRPWGIAAGDLDGAGTIDLVVANAYSSSVSVLRGNGDGTFGTRTDYPVASIPYGVAIGDLDGDDVPDVVVSSVGTHSVSVLLGAGDGTFAPYTTYPAGARCGGVAAADLDDDGALDLVVANDGIHQVSVLLGNGNGTFQPPRYEPVNHAPWGIICADFDGNGTLDLGLGCESIDQMAVLLGSGDGTFAAAAYYPVGDVPWDVAAADFDRDGIIDVVASNRNDNDLSVLLGNGDGTFAAAYDYPAASWPRGLVCADLNGDARTDIAAANQLSHRVSVLLNVHNAAPTADAGPDLTLHWTQQATTTVEGQGFDPDPNEDLTYQWWDVTDPGSPALLLDWSATGLAGEADLDLSLVPAFPIGSSELQLEVSDGEDIASDSMLLTVTNSAPDADAGENQMVNSEDQLATVILGSASDLDGDTVLYRWADVTGGAYVLLTDWTPTGPAGGAPLAVADFGPLPAGEYTLRLEVTDGLEVAHSDMVLTIENSPPHVSMIGCGTYHYGDAILVSGDISDFDGDLIEWQILRDTTVLALGDIETPTGGAAVMLPWVDLTADLGIGTHELVLTGSDGINLSQSAPCVVAVIDVEAPTLVPIPSVSQLWPPNHKLVAVTIEANAYDNSGGPVYLDVSVMSSEPPDGEGDGSTEPDWIIDGIEDGPGGMVHLQLRSERSGKGEGRTYTVTIVATDAYGNSSSAQVSIVAPHDKGKR